jgi:membrane protein implicated in regulation of membrane protease activity
MAMIITMALPFLGIVLFLFLPFWTALPIYLCLLLLSGLMYYGMFSAMGGRRKVQTGFEQMIGEEAVVIEDLDPDGKVEIMDEIWRATANGKRFHSGEKVKICGVQGLMLVVEDLDDNKDTFRNQDSFPGKRFYNGTTLIGHERSLWKKGEDR